MDATPLEIRDALLGYVANNVTASLVFPNEKNTKTESPFVRVDTRFTSSETIIKGAGTITRHRGLLFLEVFYSLNKDGSRISYEIATDLCNILERKRIGGVVTRNATLNEVSLDNNYSILSVEIPFLSS